MVSQRSSGHRPPTLDDQTLARLQRTPTEPPPFPRELSRCRCGTPSFDPGDHAAPCPLGPTPPLSSNPVASADISDILRQGF